MLTVLCALACHGQARKSKPLKVYLLAGQLNMTGIVSIHTLEHVKMAGIGKGFAEAMLELHESKP